MTACAGAQARPQGERVDAGAAVLAAEDALFAADVRHDVAAIARGFADEMVFVHANGTVQTKADYLQAAIHPRFPITSVIGTDRVVRVFGQVATVRGTKTVVAGDMRLLGTYLSVYIRRDGRWQLLDQQSSPAPRESAGVQNSAPTTAGVPPREAHPR